MKRHCLYSLKAALAGLLAVTCLASAAFAQEASKPNIVVILGDDIGWFNVPAYSGDLMGAPTPNIDRIGKEGLRLTAFYAQPSCTAGRAAFITGQLPVRTGLTTVGTPGSPAGLQKEDITLAEVLKARGYATRNSVRTISATSRINYRTGTVSTSISATSITSTPTRISKIPTGRPTPSSAKNSIRAPSSQVRRTG
jgi:hypothetical protein